MEVSLAVTQETTYEVEIHGGLDYQAWLTAGRVSKTFTSLDEILADEKTLRQLMLVHDAVDYICNTFNTGLVADITKIFNTDLAAKWINLSDYALDHFYAVSGIKSIMDTADKYGYGEWVITDNTTTPPTWGPKGNVPVMTSNTAPYGTASSYPEHSTASYKAWAAFDGNESTDCASGSTSRTGYIQYKFTNPCCIRLVSILPFENNGNSTPKDFDIQGSNDGTNFDTLLSVDSATWSGKEDFEVNNSNYYIYYRLNIRNVYATSDQYATWRIKTLQFYGRELKVSVPVMTSNTAPFGTTVCSSAQTSYEAYRGFDNNKDTAWMSTDNSFPAYLGYRFTNKKIKLCMLLIQNRNASGTNTNYPTSFNVQGSNDNFTSDINDLASNLSATSTAASGISTYTIDTSDLCSDYRVYVASASGTSGGIVLSLASLQFYGLDYSEKEFEVGTTKKWLYDHGVELVEITDRKGTNGVTPLHGSDSIILQSGSASSNSYSQIQIISDLTPYTLDRVKVIRAKYSSNTCFGINVAAVGADTELATNWVTASTYIPYNLSLNISSINQQARPLIAAGSGSSSTIEIVEWWLE